MKLSELFEGLFENHEHDYRGDHSAPTNNEYDKPIWNIVPIYPDDIYSDNAARYYGDGVPYDQESINIIQSLKNKPNTKLKIYRAVPFDNTNDKTIKALKDLLIYYRQFNFFPMKNKIIDSIEQKYEHLLYNEKIQMVYKDIEEQINNAPKSEKLDINIGDWITINKQYAIDHGKSNLNNKYKIISKTVYARDVYTDGNSIHEFGYDPQPMVRKH